MSRLGTGATLLVVAFMAIAAWLAASGMAAGPVSMPTAQECKGVAKCIKVPGPWVIVPSHGEVGYVLSCPQNQGFAVGVDSLATSRDIRVTFDGLMGSPIASGRTTGPSILFRAVSASHEQGAFQPFIGCIPLSTQAPQTVSLHLASSARIAAAAARTTLAARATPAAPKASPVVVTPAGPPLSTVAKTIALTPGSVKTASLGCSGSQRMVDSWTATAFGTVLPPKPVFANGVRVRLRTHADNASVSISTSETIPGSAAPQVQLVVRCAQR